MQKLLLLSLWLSVWKKTGDPGRADSAVRVGTRALERLRREMQEYRRDKAWLDRQAKDLIAHIKESGEISGVVAIQLLQRSEYGTRSYVVELRKTVGDVYAKY